MCGIIGYIGQRSAAPILVRGLKELLYRGYDSAGLALMDAYDDVGTLAIRKVVGKEDGDAASKIQLLLEASAMETVGIGHNRWATHGEPNETNAHPHVDCRRNIAVIHNGIIENYGTLKKNLETVGHAFQTATDTEVLAHLIEEAYDGDLSAAVRAALKLVEGTYGLAVMHVDHPRTIVGARLGSPLLVGSRNGERFLASDAKALKEHTPAIQYLDDGQLVVLNDAGFAISSIADGSPLPAQLKEIEWEAESSELDGYESRMLKEIHEQPDVVRNACRGRLNDERVRLGGLEDHLETLIRAREVIFIGSGTSRNAAEIGKWFCMRYARIKASVEQSNQFAAVDPVIEPFTVAVAISQSGETIDTLDALRTAQKGGAVTFGLVNVVGSTIAREAGKGVYLLAGPEIAVASTKAFVSQVTALGLFALYLGQHRHTMRPDQLAQARQALLALPEKIEQILAQADAIQAIAEVYAEKRNALFLARGLLYPVALEGALKLKEISYVHAEGYDAGEMKHGPIALIDKDMPVVVIAPRDPEYDRVVGNIEEVKARKGKVIAVVTEGDERVKALADHVITIPETAWIGAPILATVPLQLLAYFIARARGLSVDKVDRPRNLAKSVTVR